MDSNKKELLKTSLQAGEYISCTESNKEIIMQVINELHEKTVYIFLDDIDEKAYLATQRKAFSFQISEIITLQFEDSTHTWNPVF